MSKQGDGKGKATLGRLHKARKAKRETDPALDSGAAAALLLGLLWGVIHGFAPDTSVWGAAGVALLSSVSFLLAGAFVGGVIEDSVGPKWSGFIGLGTAFIGGGVIGLRWYPWWQLLPAVAVAFVAFVPGYIKARRALARDFGFDADTTSALAALPEALPKDLRQRVDAAMDTHQKLVDLSTATLTAPDLVDDALALQASSALALRVVAQQVGIVHQLRGLPETPSLIEALRSAEAALADVEGEVLRLLEGAGLYVAARRSDQLAKVRAQAEHLRLTAAALAELDALEDS